MRGTIRVLIRLAVFILGIILASPSLSAADTKTQPRTHCPRSQTGNSGTKAVVTTKHSLTIPDGELHYTVRTGEIPIPGEKEQNATARIFFTAYTLDNGSPEDRPLTFAFNGGPGAASVWLHLGALGPKIVSMPSDGSPPQPPARLQSNPLTWLRFSDLVFIDPVGTGYSRSQEQEKAESFWGLEEDIRSVGKCIRLYLTRQKRWLSPKYLVGESYGSTRAAALSTHLDETYGIRLNGIVLISPALDYATLDVHNGHILPYALFLPSYAAGAAQHARGNAQENQSLSDLLHTVEDFARGDYLQGLFQGDDLSARDAERFYARTAEYTGLKPQLIQRCRGRISPWLLRKELLREQTMLIGRMDTGVTGLDPAQGSPFPKYDPSLRPLFGPFSSAVNAYIRQDLQYESERVYEFLNPRVGRRWNWCQALQKDALGQGYVNAADNLKEAMSINPALKVFLACGLFDLATPYFATQYTVNQMHLDPRIRKNLELVRYPAGHMIYLRQQPRKQLYQDVRSFYQRSCRTDDS